MVGRPAAPASSGSRPDGPRRALAGGASRWITVGLNGWAGRSWRVAWRGRSSRGFATTAVAASSWCRPARSTGRDAAHGQGRDPPGTVSGKVNADRQLGGVDLARDRPRRVDDLGRERRPVPVDRAGRHTGRRRHGGRREPCREDRPRQATRHDRPAHPLSPAVIHLEAPPASARRGPSGRDPDDAGGRVSRPWEIP